MSFIEKGGGSSVHTRHSVPPSPARDKRAVRGRIQSTPTLQAPPPKGDRRAGASPHSVVANRDLLLSSSVTYGATSPKGGQK